VLHLWQHNVVFLVTAVCVCVCVCVEQPLTCTSDNEIPHKDSMFPRKHYQPLKQPHRITRGMDEIHSGYILKLTVHESPVQKPDHAQIQLFQSYLFVIVLLIKLHYRMLFNFLASWPFITIFRLPFMFLSTLHLPNKYKYT